MADETVTLSSAWRQAEHARDQALGCNAQAPDYQDIVTRALNLYKRCSTLADQLSLFSRNEDIEEVASRDLGFLQISHRLGELTERSYGGDRKSTLILARSHYQAFLENLELYHLLSKIETVLLDDFRAEPSSFSVSSSSDPAVRRQTKIARFLTDKELKQKLKVLEQDPRVLQDDEEAVRNLQITNLHYLAHITFQSLELIALELGIIAKAPVQPQRPTDGGSSDDRRRDADIRTDFSERLDSGRNGRSIGTGGPILSPDGKPLQPFTILGKREEFTQGVFRPGHSLPTMTVEEYLEEERRRGGMIEGGGAASMKQPVINEDDLELADRATMKARDWDEFKESNPRGAGNTINRG